MVSGGHHDFGGRGQDSSPFQRLRGLPESPPDRCGRRLGVSLGKPQERKTRLRLPPEAVRFSKRLLGCDEVALETQDLPLQVQRVARTRRAHRPLGPVARSTCFVERVGPGTVELHDLGAVCAAAAAERHHFRLLLAPA